MTQPGEEGRRRAIRVLWLIKGLDRGGAEKLLVSLAQAHDRRAVDIECAYLLPHRSQLVADLQAAGVAVECLTGRADSGDHDKDFDVRWALALRRRLVERPVDILHLHLRYPATVGRLVAYSLPAGRRPRLVFTEHNVWGADVLIPRIGNRLTIGLDDADVAVSAVVRRSLPAGLGRRVHEVVHGIPTAEVEEARRYRDEVRAELGVGPDEILIGTVANYRAQKAYDVLLSAAALVVSRAGGVRFVAVGHGPLAGEVEELHRAHGLGDRFLLLGHRDDAVRLLSGFDIFVLASRFEGFPVSIMEATALGLPVVATAVGGIPEAVTDGVEGHLVPVDRPDLLAQALLDLVERPATRAAMAAASRARGRDYDINRAARRIEQIYGEVVEKGWSWAPEAGEPTTRQRRWQRLPR